MKTFSQSLRLTNHIKNLENCLKLMEQAGISPKKFVNWYCSDGIHYQERNELQEAAHKWLKHQMYFIQQNINPNDVFSEFFGLGQNNVQKASSELRAALSDFSARFQRSAALQQQVNNPRFNETIMGLINSLKIFGSAVGGEDQADEEVESFDHTIHNNPYLPESVSSKAKLKNEIRQTLKEIANMGVSPEIVYEFYITNLQGKNLNEGLWDYARQLGSGVMSWMGGKGFASGWQEKGTQIDQENNRRSIDNVLMKIDAMEKTLQLTGSKPHQDFVNYAKTIKDTLQNLKQQQPPAEQPAGEQPGQAVPENISDDDLGKIFEQLRANLEAPVQAKDLPKAKEFVNNQKNSKWSEVLPDQKALFRQYVTGVAKPAGGDTATEAPPINISDEDLGKIWEQFQQGQQPTYNNKNVVFKINNQEATDVLNSYKTRAWKDLDIINKARIRYYVTGDRAEVENPSDWDLSRMWEIVRRRQLVGWPKKIKDGGKLLILQDTTPNESNDFIEKHKDDVWGNLNPEEKAQFKKMLTGKAPETSWTRYDDEEAFMESIYGAYKKKTSWMFHE